MINDLLGSTPKTYPASLLLNFDGSNGGTTFTDSSSFANTVTVYNGSVTTSTSQSVFGGSSLFVDNGYLQVASNSALNLSSGNFTIEFWVKPDTQNQPYPSILGASTWGAENAFSIRYSNVGLQNCFSVNSWHMSNYFGNETYLTSGPFAPGNWHHVAVTRSGLTDRLFVDGILTSSYTFDTPQQWPDLNADATLKIGSSWDGARGQFKGYIDDLRITKGVALYTESYFAPPLYALSKNSTIAPKLFNHLVMISTKSSGNITGNISTSTGFYAVNWYDGTKTIYASDNNFSKSAIGGNQYITIYPCAGVPLLLHFNGGNGSTAFVDSSSNNTVITQNGNVTTSTTQSKFGGSSAYFNGNSFLSFPVGNNFILSNDFTVEFWVYPTISFPTSDYVLWFGLSSGAGDYFGVKNGNYVAQFGGTGEMFWSGSPSINAWTHIALVRSGSTVTLYVNGTSLGNYTKSTPWLNSPSSNVQIGAFASQFFTTGYIDEFRITKGQALYKSNFTPSTAELSSDINANLSGYFLNVDISNNNLTSVRPLYSRFTSSIGYNMPGYTRTWYFYNSYYSRGYNSSYAAGAYVPGSPYHLDVSSNILDASALNQIYTDLLNGTGSIDVSDNIGGDTDNPNIATSKGYTVFGSVSPYTTLLLNLNGSYTDSSSQNISISALGGSPSFSTSIKKYGSSSLSLNGGNIGNDSFVIPDLSQVDYTIEFWIYRPTATNTYEGIVNLSNGSSPAGINIHLYNSNDINFNDGQAGAAAGGTIGANQWYHVACVSKNNVKKLFIDGTLVSSGNQVTPAGPYKLKIGATYSLSQTSNAYIDDFRIIRGKALYATNFTPPTSQLTTYP